MNSAHNEKVPNASGSRDYLQEVPPSRCTREFIYPSRSYPLRRLANEHGDQTGLISGTYRDNEPGI